MNDRGADVARRMDNQSASISTAVGPQVLSFDSSPYTNGDRDAHRTRGRVQRSSEPVQLKGVSEAAVQGFSEGPGVTCRLPKKVAFSYAIAFWFPEKSQFAIPHAAPGLLDASRMLSVQGFRQSYRPTLKQSASTTPFRFVERPNSLGQLFCLCGPSIIQFWLKYQSDMLHASACMHSSLKAVPVDPSLHNHMPAEIPLRAMS